MPELDRLDDRSPDIDGLTSIDHVFGAICDWANTGSGNLVFPGRDNTILEYGANISEVL